MAGCGCSDSCNCNIIAGDGIVVSASGDTFTISAVADVETPFLPTSPTNTVLLDNLVANNGHSPYIDVNVCSLFGVTDIESSGQLFVVSPDADCVPHVLEPAPDANHVLGSDGDAGVAWVPTPSLGSGVPTGTVLPYAGDVAPLGFLLIDTYTFDIASYPDLAAIINGKYDAEVPSVPVGEMAFPPVNRRVIVGASQDGTTIANGDTDGQVDETLRARDHLHAITNFLTSFDGGHGQLSVSGSTDSRAPSITSGVDNGEANNYHTGYILSLTGRDDLIANLGYISATDFRPTTGGGGDKFTKLVHSHTQASHNHALVGALTQAVADHQHTVSGNSDSESSPWVAMNYIIKT